MKISQPNSVWPNGLKKDAEGYSVFYPLGTNKVNVADITWPTGDELRSPFVYENGKLVGLFDSKALEGDTFDIPYTKADMVICGNPITINLVDECDKFSITLTKSTSGPIIGKSGENEISADYSINAPEMTSAVGMFSNRKIKSIKLDIPKLEDATDMFSGCTLTSEVIYSILESIPAGKGGNINLGVYPEDITESELINAFAEKGWIVSSITIVDITGESEIRYFTILDDAQKDALSRTVKIVNNECYDETDTKIANFDTTKVVDLTNVIRIEKGYLETEEVDASYSEGTSPITLEMSLSKLSHFESDLTNLVNGSGLFYDSSIKTFKSDLSSLKHQIRETVEVVYPAELVEEMNKMSNLEKSFYEVLLKMMVFPNFSMFSSCENFDANMPLLENGNDMFHGNLLTFNGDLSSLKKAKGMFGVSRDYLRAILGFVYTMVESDLPVNSYSEFINYYLYNIIHYPYDYPFATFFEKEYTIFKNLNNAGIADANSFLNIINSINDLSKDSTIVYDEKTGEGYIDIDCEFSKEYFEGTTGLSWGETLGILETKGWKYHVKIIGLGGVDFYKNYEIIDEEKEGDGTIITGKTYKEIPQEKLEEVEQSTEIIENKCYINGELIEDFDLTEIAVTNSFKVSVTDNDFVYIPKNKMMDDLDTESTSIESAFALLLLFGFLINKENNDLIAPLSSDEEHLALLESLCMQFSSIKNVRNSSLPNLINGNCLFMNGNIENFECDMENLEEAGFMFTESSLINFKGNMPKLRLQSAGYVGAFQACPNLSSFEGDLSSLRCGIFMFAACENLESFKSDLSSLEIGLSMFGNGSFWEKTSLNADSVDNIADTIKDMSGVMEREKELLLADPSYVDEDGNLFSETIELGTLDVGLGFNPSDYNGKYGTWDNLKAAFSAKKWKVNFYFPSGSSESTTFGLRDRNTNILYTKLEEVHPHTKTISKEDFDKKVDESDCPERFKEKIKNKFKNMPTVKYTTMPRHDYTSQDGTKYYRLTHFHDSNVDYSDYDQFGSLEEAVEYYGVKPVSDTTKLNLPDVMKRN